MFKDKVMLKVFIHVHSLPLCNSLPGIIAADEQMKRTLVKINKINKIKIKLIDFYKSHKIYNKGVIVYRQE